MARNHTCSNDSCHLKRCLSSPYTCTKIANATGNDTKTVVEFTIKSYHVLHEEGRFNLAKTPAKYLATSSNVYM